MSTKDPNTNGATDTDNSDSEGNSKLPSSSPTGKKIKQHADSGSVTKQPVSNKRPKGPVHNSPIMTEAFSKMGYFCSKTVEEYDWNDKEFHLVFELFKQKATVSPTDDKDIETVLSCEKENESPKKQLCVFSDPSFLATKSIEE
eukprot:4149278-Ditylum_brightwellii.AAC.1